METKQYPDMECDVVIAGCGVAGLYCALNLPRALNVVLLSKEDVASCDSMLAQGGICVLHDPDDYESFFEDTLRAGHYENRLESVDMMIRASRPIIDDLIKRGVRFARTATGELDYTREGAHSRPRIVYHEDITGEEITDVLFLYNLNTYLGFDKIIACGGSWMVESSLVREKKFDVVESLCREASEIVKSVRG